MVMLSKKIVIIDVDVDTFYASMLTEVNSLDAKRFSFSMKKKNKEIIFSIKAHDETALKAATSSINKLTTVFKKMDVLKNDERSTTRKNTRVANS